MQTSFLMLALIAAPAAFEGRVVQTLSIEVAGASPNAASPAAMKTTRSTWIRKDGATRSQVEGKHNGPAAAANVDVLILPKQNKLITLFHAQKTFTEEPMPKAEDETDAWVVTELGKERVKGFKTVHVRLHRPSAPETTHELWMAPALVAKGHLDEYRGALARAGLKPGFPLRQLHRGGDVVTTVEPVKVERRRPPQALFKVPKGYRPGPRMVPLTSLLPPARQGETARAEPPSAGGPRTAGDPRGRP